MNLFLFLLGLNKKYDSMSDPKRFLTMLLLVVPGVVLVFSGDYLRNLGTVSMGFLWLAFLFCCRMVAVGTKRGI